MQIIIFTVLIIKAWYLMVFNSQLIFNNKQLFAWSSVGYFKTMSTCTIYVNKIMLLTIDTTINRNNI